MNNLKKKENLENNSSQLQQIPFDVMNNKKLLINKIGDNDNLINWVKKQPNFKGVIPFYFTPIVENQKQYDLYNFEVSNSQNFVSERNIKGIPLQNVEITTDVNCNINSITLIITLNNKVYKVVSNNDYGIIKSRYLIDSKGLFKNYEKCELVLFEGEYIEYRLNEKRYSDDRIEFNKVFNYKNGIKDGQCKTFYKGDYPYHSFNSSNGGDIYWYELITYLNGKKEGLYENTKNVERGSLVNGKRVGEWIVQPPKDIRIPNFNITKRNNDEVFDRIKCNYSNSKLNGKWVGITLNEFFGLSESSKTIHKIGGVFKNGIMNGKFYSEYWNDEYKIVKGEFKNNLKFGNWSNKISDVSFIGDWTSHKDFSKGKNWYNNNKCFTSDEIDNYQIITEDFGDSLSFYNTEKSRKIETFKNNELVEISVSNNSEIRNSFTLKRYTSPLNNFTKEYIPSEFQNIGFSLYQYDGRILKDGEEKFLRLWIKDENVLGYRGINEHLLLENGYSITTIGKNRFDKRKSKTYPSLPLNSNDYYELGEYNTLTIELDRVENKFVSIDNELYLIGDSKNENETKNKLEDKKQQIIKKVVNLLIVEKENELNKIKEKESKEFSCFPMD